MDIYRKELDEIYHRQGLAAEQLPAATAARAASALEGMAALGGACCVLTDIAADCSLVAPAQTGRVFGLTGDELATRRLNSSDEDFLYARIHPADLVDLRMLEYEFFSRVDTLPVAEKTRYRAVADVRMRGADGRWLAVSKGTQVVELSPLGRMWLVLCTYEVLGAEPAAGTDPRIIDLATGQTRRPALGARRASLLTPREKELLRLVGRGLLSKEIAATLGISVNTVNRHRQNILSKLSVANSIEAVNAAQAMRLL